MGQQGDDASAPGNFGQPRNWTPEQAPPTVTGPAAGSVPPVPGPGAEQPNGPQFQASPWPAYQPQGYQPPPGDQQYGGQPQWGQQPGGPQPQWGQRPGGQPQWGAPPQPGGYGGPFSPYGGQPQGSGPGMLFQRYRRSRRRRPVRRTLAIVFLVLVIGGVIAAVNRNSGSDDNSDTPSNAPVATYTAAVGSGVTLAGLDAGEQMNVTVSKVFNSPVAAEFNQAPAGDRLYAVQFALKDTGSAAYSDAPGNSATVFDSAGQSFQTKFDETSDCTSLPAITNIAAGASASGCVVFDVPKASKITKVQFILDSGDGPQTGVWKIG